ncbi:chaperone J-domain-containing protein [Coleophoma cylindrospora]|uniref:Chaperone J-domain-containing protein n=1 Tax=Coleophoma cylindrospora TaxID=1849047 RepID=A0A3D8S0S1_9HELO|nr:chaperone J-domain-containing protein [Coleophoma cylindrospora]
MKLPSASLFLLCLVQLAACAEDFYKLLGIDKQASDREIKRAYRTLSKKYHPDKNPGNETAKQKFVEVAEAYEALSTPETRKIYDQYGHEGLKQRQQQGGGGGHHDPFDLFSRFFGGGGHFGHQPGQRRGPDMEVRVGVPLRDIYNGHQTEFQLEKQQICEECEGSGSADGQVDTCSACGGHGMQLKKHMLAPGIFQQVQVQCEHCGGQGKTIKHKCPVCSGTRVVRKLNTYQLNVERGAPKGHKMKYENDADESPDWVAGDLHVTLMEKDPSLEDDNELHVDGTFFRRKGDELYWKEPLSLREAWMGGWTRNLTHLDGHVVPLSRKRGQVIQPGQIERVKGEGMPKWHEDGDSVYHQTEFGDLLVEYTVILPDQMESGMEKDFWALWDKWRKKNGVDLQKDSGRPEGDVKPVSKDEL